jgi:hypothetical protein
VREVLCGKQRIGTAFLKYGKKRAGKVFGRLSFGEVRRRLRLEALGAFRGRTSRERSMEMRIHIYLIKISFSIEET